MTDNEVSDIIKELGKVSGRLEGVQTSLDHGTQKMDNLLNMGIENGSRITALEEASKHISRACAERHSGCDDIHAKIASFKCPAATATETGVRSKFLNITFDQLIKFGGFIAVIATCGMVAFGEF